MIRTERFLISATKMPLSSELGKNEAVKARFWPWLELFHCEVLDNILKKSGRMNAGQGVGRSDRAGCAGGAHGRVGLHSNPSRETERITDHDSGNGMGQATTAKPLHL